MIEWKFNYARIIDWLYLNKSIDVYAMHEIYAYK